MGINHKKQGRKLKNKGDFSPLYFIIAGILLFILVSCTMGKGIVNVFKTSISAQDNLDDLTESMGEVADDVNRLEYKLVPLRFEKETGIYIFNPNTDLVESRQESHSLKRVIIRPDGCVDDKLCVCSCTDAALNEPDEEIVSEAKIKYPSIQEVQVRELDCGELICASVENAKLKEEINLMDIVSAEKYESMKGLTYTMAWTGGLSFIRPKKNDVNSEQQIASAASEYLDTYIINNNDGTISLCFTADCIKTNTN